MSNSNLKSLIESTPKYKMLHPFDNFEFSNSFIYKELLKKNTIFAYYEYSNNREFIDNFYMKSILDQETYLYDCLKVVLRCDKLREYYFESSSNTNRIILAHLINCENEKKKKEVESLQLKLKEDEEKKELNIIYEYEDCLVTITPAIEDLVCYHFQNTQKFENRKNFLEFRINKDILLMTEEYYRTIEEDQEKISRFLLEKKKYTLLSMFTEAAHRVLENDSSFIKNNKIKRKKIENKLVDLMKTKEMKEYIYLNIKK